MDTTIIWDLDPELVRLWGSWPIRYYSLCFAGGIVLASLLVSRLLKRDGVPDRHTDRLATYIILGIVLGARLGHCLFYDFAYFSRHPWEIILPFHFEQGQFQFTGFLGLASHGGAIGVLLAILIFCRQYQYRLLPLLDKIVIGGAFAAVFIRLGNFMNSEIIGKPTGTDFGVIFLRVDHIVRHPAQLYEAFAYLLIFFLLVRWYQRPAFRENSGRLFGSALVLIFSARFFIEFLKIDQVAFEQAMWLNMGQWLSIPFVVIGVYFYWRRPNPSRIA